MKNFLFMTKDQLIEQLRSTEPRIWKILKNSRHVEEARHVIFDYLNRLDRDLYNLKSDTYFVNLNIIEKRNAKECIRVLMNTMRSENEYLTKVSPLEALYDIAHGKEKALEAVTEAFLCDYLALFLGITGKAGKHVRSKELFVHADGREAAVIRSDQLDEYGSYVRKYFRRYKTGLDRSVIRERKAFKDVILKYFKGNEEDWRDYRWHLRHTIKDIKTLRGLVKLSKSETEGLRCAEKENIPFEITPYYLSLFHREGQAPEDRQIRAQVIPSRRYCESVAESRQKGFDMDFMGEKSTSPIDGITRRYPEILILKPYNACPQIRVYCQRNWEIKTMDEDVMMSRKKIRDAIAWISEHESISEVLITGGDPLTLDNKYLDWLIGEVAKIGHVERIRIGTRTPVTLPFRIDDGFIAVIKKYHRWGRREITIVTHFEHAAEVTPDAVEAIRRLKEAGVNVYNQQVFTYYNSRKFETALLRKTIKIAGVDPYYSFSTKGKEETIDFRVPIARIEQERREEARLQPGLVRTDDPVFNVPKLGKSNLRAWQDHEVIMVRLDGSRVYRFYSWEVRLLTALDYLYTDVPIYDYLKRLSRDGENVSDYISIWYYF